MNDELKKKFADARCLFPHAGDVAYFNAASYGPFCTPVKEAIDANVKIRLEAKVDDSHEAFAVHDKLRQDYAGLIGADKREVGVALSTTYGLNIAAFGLPLKEGDEVLVSDVEFPAAVYTFKGAAQARGFKVRFVESTDRFFDIEKFRKAITPRTRALVLSFVQYFNGFKNDLDQIGAICKEHDIVFVVDGIQGMGAEVIDVRKSQIDIFSSGCQKWMLAPQGCGFFYLSDDIRDRLVHSNMSWLSADWNVEFTNLFRFDLPYFDSARRFEMGYYAVLNLLGMNASVEIFKSLGIDNIQQHNHELIDRLVNHMRANSFYSITSSMEGIHRSSIFTFKCPRLDELHAILGKRGIKVVKREGSIRVSVHLYNNEEDIDRLIAVLDEFAG
ncbi:MAG: aminotransferase class V-fold PLP-dependent enzyme [Candidatus Zixiibacteriota bacterium]